MGLCCDKCESPQCENHNNHIHKKYVSNNHVQHHIRYPLIVNRYRLPPYNPEYIYQC